MSSNSILDENDYILHDLEDESTMGRLPPAPLEKDHFAICSAVNPSLSNLPQFQINDEIPAFRISSNSLTLSDSFDQQLDHGSFERISVAHSSRLVINDDPSVSFTRAYVLACFVFWLCGFIAGSLAYIEAVKGEGSAYDGDLELAKRRRKISYHASIAGLAIGLIAIVTTALMLSILYSMKH